MGERIGKNIEAKGRLKKGYPKKRMTTRNGGHTRTKDMLKKNERGKRKRRIHTERAWLRGGHFETEG